MTHWILSKLIAAVAGLVYYHVWKHTKHTTAGGVDDATRFGKQFARIILADDAP